MLKRAISFLLILGILISIFANLIPVQAADFDNAAALGIYMNRKFADIQAKAYAVYDCNHDQFIALKNSDEKRQVASLVKMMTVYIAFEYIRLGYLNLSDTITTSIKAENTPGATVYISAGDTFSVESALYAIIIGSYNDATVALAERIALTEADFVDLMNLHAKSIGMLNTNFVDCTGIDDAGYTTAYDMALLSNVIVKNYFDDYMKISKKRYDETIFKNGTGKFTLYNTNNYLKFVPASDGLKVGSTLSAMYCIAATYQEDGRRLIVVMLGASSENDLYAETRRAFDYCLAYYTYEEIQKDGELVTDEIKVKKGVSKTVSCSIKGSFSRVLTADEKKKVIKETELPNSLDAPLSAGDVIGKAIYKIDDQVICELDIVLDEDVEKAGWFQIFIEWLLEWFGFA